MLLPALLLRARNRHWLVTLAELRSLGVSDRAIQHAVRAGELHRVHHGVYAVGRPDLSTEGRWLAATLALPASWLCAFSAAALFALVPASSGPVHVLQHTTAGRRRRPGIVAHRTVVAPRVTWRAGIPTTTIERTLRDLAATMTPRQRTRAVRQAEVLHRLDLPLLRARLETAPVGAVRERRLLRVVDAYVPGDVNEGLEELVLRACVEADVGLPVTQHRIGRDRVDFAWPDVRLALEADDRRSHDTDVGFGDDRARDRRIRALGWEVMRVTHAELRRDLRAIRDEIAAAHRRRWRETHA